MRAHTITTKASTIVPGGILALGLAVVLLGATASPASADRFAGPVVGAEAQPPDAVLGTWYCPPPSTPLTTFDQVAGCLGEELFASFDFGYQQLGTTSPAQRFALVVFNIPGHDSFNPRISVSGDYAQTNNCPPTLSAGQDLQGCLITVTFTPTTRKSQRRGTLTAGPGEPTVALTGTAERSHLQLSGPKKQSPQDDYPGCDGGACDVRVEASCGGGECTARSKGKLTHVKNDELKPTSVDVAPGQTKGTGLELTKESQRKQVRKALAEGKNVQAKVTVRAKYASGKVETAKRTIKLVK
jgi:hypothetical protein